MIERVLEWLRGPKVIIHPEADLPDFDRLAHLIENGDPGDPNNLEEIARLFGQTDPERF